MTANRRPLSRTDDGRANASRGFIDFNFGDFQPIELLLSSFGTQGDQLDRYEAIEFRVAGPVHLTRPTSAAFFDELVTVVKQLSHDAILRRKPLGSYPSEGNVCLKRM